MVKREHKNVGPRISSHNICKKDVRGELPIGSVARKISEGSSDVRLESRTRAVRICKAALRHPWIHSPHVLRSGTCGGAAPNVVRNWRASMVVFASTVVELRVLPVIPRL